MITAGVDVGTRFLKICIVEDRRIISTIKSEMNGAFEKIYHNAFSKALDLATLKKKDIRHIAATGYGAHHVKKALTVLGNHICVSKGMLAINSDVQTVIDIGGYFIRVIVLNDSGAPIDYHENEKCAAGIDTDKQLRCICRK